jgi:hypothetical protein
LVAAAVGTFCSVTTRKATEHSYLNLLGIWRSGPSKVEITKRLSAVRLQITSSLINALRARKVRFLEGLIFEVLSAYSKDRDLWRTLNIS